MGPSGHKSPQSDDTLTERKKGCGSSRGQGTTPISTLEPRAFDLVTTVVMIYLSFRDVSLYPIVRKFSVLILWSIYSFCNKNKSRHSTKRSQK